MLFLKTLFLYSFLLYVACQTIPKIKNNKAFIKQPEKNQLQTTNQAQASRTLSSTKNLAKKEKTATKIASKKKSKRQPTQSPSLLKDIVFQEWTIELKQIQKNLSQKNFKKTLNNTLCPQLEKLSQINYKKTKPADEYFKELIKVYGSITNYTMDHNYFYCLADLLKDPSHKWLKSFSQTFLNQKEKEKLLDRLNICYQESTEGNGDVISQSLDIKPLKVFSQMNTEEKKAYTEKLRELYLETE